MEIFSRVVRRIATALKDLVSRFLKNQARNTYEEILFNATKSLILQYGRA